MDYLVDTHCHIQSINQSVSELWTKDPNLTILDVLTRAQANKVKIVIAVGCDFLDSKLAVDLGETYPDVYASVGVHPHAAGDVFSKQKFEQLLSSKIVKAIGECGLDYYYHHSSKESQIEVFKYQVNLAKKHNLPLIFHVRSAFEDFWPIIEQNMPISGVIHSFTDSRKNLERALDYNFKIGVNGMATFTKDSDQIEMYRSIPLTSLVVETDSPYLTPVPLRGKLNEPKNVLYITEFLAKLRGESLQKVINQTTINAKQLFKL